MNGVNDWRITALRSSDVKMNERNVLGLLNSMHIHPGGSKRARMLQEKCVAWYGSQVSSI